MQQEDLNRFVEAQKGDYETALAEIKAGKKRSHWMWYIFPQMAGLGFSALSKKYGIRDLGEARAYLAHPLLGPRLVAVSRQLLQLPGNNATQIFGSPDDLKLRSCLTLFALASPAHEVFNLVLSKFFDGKKDPHTLAFLKEADKS
ncbi:DUF1810 domain-containing protein [Mucilaginibacter phyllosphaerae]|uniref:DUF1810 domain-containing protein n=1 Tax=Mucilaginibacter phyllosphaerae TaxID=1812349 RepID=A0A4Y8AK66_9SPHI|nr:DUF1810 domain-containing protein [Mucilaginibacter phyllosphaerae]MBB3968062.1 uncharacterized protein (DUF1810 family) [Mucilaginibacter phyllosphaerae]TEW68915.1 DUF1810 domain-containing protein [Mucilaginibacter phyllosphaerae]GGH01485.1 hypothetical protein GCM10007352_03270 [Mucilaginibacter phyllosphaerae]